MPNSGRRAIIDFLLGLNRTIVKEDAKLQVNDNSWNKLEKCFRQKYNRRIDSLFEVDPERAEKFSLAADGLLLDFSKTLIDSEALELLLDLYAEMRVANRRRDMFEGKRINATENRAVLHTALRDADGRPVLVDGIDVKPGIRNSLSRMREFAEGVRDGSIRPARAERFTDVLNIGIGGSDLGPAMASTALAPYCDSLRPHFVSNVDGAHVRDVTALIDPKTTLVIIVSKTFTTIETMTNAKTVRNWLECECGGDGVRRQVVAVSSETGRAVDFGIEKARIFGFEDWVGGRYSVWGPVGLSLMIAIGPDNFDEFLRGANRMDAHFQNAPPQANLPVLLALAGIWHNQVAGYETLAILPYDQRLCLLPAYLQQLAMESNGKSVSLDGGPFDPAVGTNSVGAARHKRPACVSSATVSGQPHRSVRIPCSCKFARTGLERSPRPAFSQLPCAVRSFDAGTTRRCQAFLRSSEFGDRE